MNQHDKGASLTPRPLSKRRPPRAIDSFSFTPLGGLVFRLVCTGSAIGATFLVDAWMKQVTMLPQFDVVLDRPNNIAANMFLESAAVTFCVGAILLGLVSAAGVFVSLRDRDAVHLFLCYTRAVPIVFVCGTLLLVGCTYYNNQFDALDLPSINLVGADQARFHSLAQSECAILLSLVNGDQIGNPQITSLVRDFAQDYAHLLPSDKTQFQSMLRTELVIKSRHQVPRGYLATLSVDIARGPGKNQAGSLSTRTGS